MRQKVEERREAGFYPPGLEEDLDVHFRHILAHRPVDALDQLRGKIDEVDERRFFSPEKIEFDSRFPGGRGFHEVVAKLITRQTRGVLQQVQEFADAVAQALHAQVLAEEDVLHRVDALLDRFAAAERSAGTDLGVADLRSRVAELEQAEARRRFRPWFSSAAFERQFQATAEEYAEHYRSLAKRFVGSDPVLDLGCGSGRFLALLQELGVEARGVDVDDEQVLRARSRGLTVERSDVIETLACAPDGGLGGVALIQVVEHLSAQEQVEVVLLLARKLREGGIAVVETVNPRSLYTFAHAFYLDPTHLFPVHPSYLSFLFQEAGFSDTEIEWRAPLGREEQLEELERGGGDAEVFNANVRRLNELLYAPKDYALVLTR